MTPRAISREPGKDTLRWLPAILALSAMAGACHRDDPDEAAVQRVFGSTGLGDGEFSYPRALARSPVDGCVFVVDKTARIQRFGPDGDFQKSWQMPEWKNGKPTGLCVDSTNRVWAADTHYARVIAFDRDGREVLRFGSAGEGPGQFIFPTDVALDAEGFIYVGEYGGNDRISKFSPEGRYILSFADKASGDGWVERPAGLCFDAAGVLWVTDSCHHRICRYDRSGTFLGAFGAPGKGSEQLNYPYGLDVEPNGAIVVADRGNNRIVRFSSNGAWLNAWGTPGRLVGQIAQPWGVVTDGNGRLYALDSWNNRVQIIRW